MRPPTDQPDTVLGDREPAGAEGDRRDDSGDDEIRGGPPGIAGGSDSTVRVAVGRVPPDPWLTGLAYAVVVAPFALAAGRLLASPSPTLPDDLALIDLHVRRALAWKQQLGVFDHSGWNHPGPTYFYLLSLVYRVLGSSTRSLFVGATLLGGLSAVACLAVVRRRTSPARTLWAAVCLGGFATALAVGGTSATTYSESVLGALVSPWNPIVVLFPLALLLLLCAGAVDRSGVSLVGALLVASYVIQTDVSTLPLAAALVGVAGVVWLVTLWRDRRGRRDQLSPESRRSPWGRILAVSGIVGLALMWLPPLVQQATNNPGNMTSLYRFFTSGQPGQPLDNAFRAIAAAFAVPVLGPGEIMNSLLGGAPKHAGVAYAVSVVTVVASAALVAAAVRRWSRFAIGIGVLTLVGCATAVVAFAHVVGLPFGYLGIWAAVLPVTALIGVGTVPVRPPGRHRAPVRLDTPIRVALGAVAVVVAVAACVRVADLPSLSQAGDPHVVRLTQLVTPHLEPGSPVYVSDAGAGSAKTELLDVEEFIGLVNELDRAGYHPTVNGLWTAEFGPGYLTDGTEPRMVQLSTWHPTSPSEPGYVGQVGDMAVTVTRRPGTAAPSDS